jgi:hypothetical protein
MSAAGADASSAVRTSFWCIVCPKGLIDRTEKRIKIGSPLASAHPRAGAAFVRIALLRSVEHAVGGEMQPCRATDPKPPGISIDAAEQRGIEPDVDYGLAGFFGTVTGRSAVTRVGDESLGSRLNRLAHVDSHRR